MLRPLPSVALFLLALPLLVLSGCATQQYPTSWAKPEIDLSPDGCSALRGVYANGATPKSMGLIDILSGEPVNRVRADRVELKMPKEGSLTVDAYSGSQRVTQIDFSEDGETLACRRDGADIIIGAKWWAAQEMFGFSSRTVSLYKDGNGNLLAKIEESGIGFYGVIPAPGAATYWLRFPPCAQIADKPCPKEDDETDTLADRAKRSRIHLYRTESFFAGSQAMSISITGRRVGQTRPGTCLILEVDPGTHEIISTGENTSTLTLTTEAGKSYYVRQEMKVGMLKPRSLLHAVDEETGRKAVAQCRRLEASF